MNIFHKSLLTDLKKLKKTLEKITIHQNWYWEKNKIEPLIKEIANYIKRFTYHKKRHENIDEIIIRLNELLKMIQIMTSQKIEDIKPEKEAQTANQMIKIIMIEAEQRIQILEQQQKTEKTSIPGTTLLARYKGYELYETELLPEDINSWERHISQNKMFNITPSNNKMQIVLAKGTIEDIRKYFINAPINSYLTHKELFVQVVKNNTDLLKNIIIYSINYILNIIPREFSIYQQGKISGSIWQQLPKLQKRYSQAKINPISPLIEQYPAEGSQSGHEIYMCDMIPATRSLELEFSNYLQIYLKSSEGWAIFGLPKKTIPEIRNHFISWYILELPQP